ncbi:MAG: hypothetical protein KJO11_04220 [Gemmatimonadetes bacterium]|nr:hypothetical protein [Gemmatimonadota bacterium]
MGGTTRLGISGARSRMMEIKPLFDDEFPALYRYCLRMTGEPDQAQDVAQEAFVPLVRDHVDGPRRAEKATLFQVA